jgi:glycosyltransferase involved in cell wall biosynthesis
VALLSYRAHPEVGGQGVYVRYLSRALADQGHEVTVFAGPPYPELDERVRLVEVPSLDLYRPEDPFRRPRFAEFKSSIDVLEYAHMCTGAFPEPLTFTLRVARLLRDGAAFDIVHDNQSLGYGLLSMSRSVPVVATIHHPISVDRRIALSSASGRARRVQQRRWFSFVRMQARVARRLPRVISVSRSAADDVVRDFGVDDSRIAVVSNGVDPDLFRPLPEVPRVPGRIVTVASSDLPSKGLAFLIEAVAKLRTERKVELVIIGKGGRGRAVKDAVARFGIGDAVHPVGRVELLDMIRTYAEAEVAVIPSLYEGFSLPAVEAMSCGVPVVATTGSSLGEVVGEDGSGGLLVPPGDAGQLAGAIARVLDDRSLRERLSEGARRRAIDRFSWEATALATVAEYRKVMPTC